jgi:hypothetical protein
MHRNGACRRIDSEVFDTREYDLAYAFAMPLYVKIRCAYLSGMMTVVGTVNPIRVPEKIVERSAPGPSIKGL